MTPERLAEIHEHDRRDRERGSVTASMVADIADHRAELLAEVDRLNERVERAEQTIANSAEIITARDARIRELEGNLSAVRGWTRSRLEILDRHIQRDRPTPETAAKGAVLDDLTRVLDHLDTSPAPTAAATATTESDGAR